MRLYRRAISYYVRDWPMVVLLLILQIGGTTGLALLTSWPMAVLIDSVLSQNPKTDGIRGWFLNVLPSTKVGQIVGLAIIALVLMFLKDLNGNIQRIVQSHVNYRGLVRIRQALFAKLQALPLEFHKSQPQGDIIYRFNTDTLGCQHILGVSMGVVVAVSTLVSMIGILLSMHPMLTLMSFSVVPLLILSNLFFGSRVRRATLGTKQQDAHLTNLIQRVMATVGLSQAFSREQGEYDRFAGQTRHAVRAWWRLNWTEISYAMVNSLIFGAGYAAIFGYGGYIVHKLGTTDPASSSLTVGDLLVFISYLGQVWGPIDTLTGFTARMQSGVAGAMRVFEILDRPTQITDPMDPVDLPLQQRTVTLDDVRFGYTPGTEILRGVAAQIEPGQMVAFVGPSGAGKSTLLNLLPRFYDVDEGAVRLDGVDLRSVRVADVRKHIALVSQDNLMLPVSIAENIAYGRPDATLDQIIDAAKLAGADEFIRRLPDGYHTTVAEGGANLSGGQRQRLSIARALLTEAPVLVLDEPTSALDARNENLINECLHQVRGRRTIILVSHRLSSVVQTDCIYVMDNGRVVEQGTHAELVTRRGIYAKMVAHQAAEGRAVA